MSNLIASNNGIWLQNNYLFIFTLVTVAILGLLLGSFGVVVVVRKEALIGESMVHATLPGVVLSFIILKKKNIFILLLGSAISCIFMLMLFRIIKKYTKLKKTTILAVLLAGFFGFGQVLISVLDKKNINERASIEEIIFGQVAYISKVDLYSILAVSVVICTLFALFWKEIKLYTFDKALYKALGFNSVLAEIFIISTLVVCVILGIQSIGIILLTTMLIAPTFIARQFSDKFSFNFIISGAIGLISGIIGIAISHFVKNFPPSSAVIIILSGLAVLSLLFSPKRGLAVIGIKQVRYKKQINKYHYLIHLYTSSDKYELNDNTKTYLIHKQYITQDGKITDLGIKKAKNLFEGRQFWI